MPKISHPVSSPGCFLALPRSEGPRQLKPGTEMLFLPSQLVSQSSPSTPEKPSKHWCSPFAGKSFKEVPHLFQSLALPNCHRTLVLPGY